MTVNERELFHKENVEERSITTFSISWQCKNRLNCNATLLSTREFVEIEGSDYNVIRIREHGYQRMDSMNMDINENDSILKIFVGLVRALYFSFILVIPIY